MSVSASFFLKARPGLGPDGQLKNPVEYVEIRLPNSQDVVSRRAKAEDRHRFKAAYALFQAGLPGTAPEKGPTPRRLFSKKG